MELAEKARKDRKTSTKKDKLRDSTSFHHLLDTTRKQGKSYYQDMLIAARREMERDQKGEK